MPIKHAFTSAKSDGGDATLVRPSNWNDDHTGSNLEVKEIDGAPDVTGVLVIQVANGTLTDNGSGNVTITTGGGSPAVNAGALVYAYSTFR